MGRLLSISPISLRRNAELDIHFILQLKTKPPAANLLLTPTPESPLIDSPLIPVSPYNYSKRDGRVDDCGGLDS